MNSRIDQLIRQLGLQPHPEGGHFVETFRSRENVSPMDGRGSRTALTTIYYLLEKDSFSRWHRVASDEVWHWCEGGPLELFTADAAGGEVRRATLGPLSNNAQPIHVVTAGSWQAARSCGEYTLVSCSVAPGFEFSDFTLLASLPESERPVFRGDSVPKELL